MSISSARRQHTESCAGSLPKEEKKKKATERAEEKSLFVSAEAIAAAFVVSTPLPLTPFCSTSTDKKSTTLIHDDCEPLLLGSWQSADGPVETRAGGGHFKAPITIWLPSFTASSRANEAMLSPPPPSRRWHPSRQVLFIVLSPSFSERADPFPRIDLGCHYLGT